MLRDAESFAAEQPFDLVVFSGDLADKGKSEELDLARALLLDPLVKRLGLEKEQIVLAPGNHDVDRDRISKMFELGLASNLQDLAAVEALVDSADELGGAVARLDPWRSFVEASGFVAVGDSEGPLVTMRRIDIDGKSVGIAVLNSAWRCASKNDKGRLLVGGSCVEEVLRDIGDCDVRIAVVHHPLDWLHSFEADLLRIEFETKGLIVLSGHEHAPDPTAAKSPRGEAIFLQAGCLYSHVSYPNSYFVIDIDANDRRVEVKIRRWSADTQMFDAATEVAPGGVHSFELPAGGGFTDLGHPPHSTVMRMIGEAAAELRVLPEDLTERDSRPASVEDVLIKPRFLSAPFQEAQAMATFTDGVGKHEIDAADQLIEKNVVIVSGEAQSGVSSSLFWLLSSGYQMDATKMPAYLRLRGSKLGTAKQLATLAKASSMFGHRSEDSRDPELTLAIDDVEPGAGRKLERLVKFIAETPRHRYILGCSAANASAVSAALEEARVEHGQAFLAPFGKSQLRKLASTVSRGSNADIDQIYGLIRTQSLPPTPFTMLALIAVMNAGLEPDDLNTSSLLEAFVNLLLGSGELADMEQLGMNFRKRVVLLGELARALYEQDGWSMPVPDVEAMFLDFFRERALRISAGRVLRSLVARHILATDGEQVTFRHPALLQLFLGKWMLESDENKVEMLSDPEKNAAAIGHAAALKRSDRDLLERVGEYATKAIATIAERLPRSQVDQILEEFEAIDSWGGDRLDQTLAVMPERKSHKELDEELDRWSEAIDWAGPLGEHPALSTAKELEAATMLLSDVLRSSDLVNDRDLKKRLFEQASEGWILLIGVTAAEDVYEGSVRAMIEEVINRVLREQGEDEDLDLKDLMGQFMLLLVTVVIGSVAQAKLGAKSLAETIEACLDDEEFTESTTAFCLAVWIESNLDLPEWPRRLDELLDRLSPGTYLHNATVALAVAHYRSSSDEIADKLEEVLARRLAAQTEGTSGNPRAEKASISKTREQLRKSRRAWQGGLLPSNRAGKGAPDLLGSKTDG